MATDHKHIGKSKVKYVYLVEHVPTGRIFYKAQGRFMRTKNFDTIEEASAYVKENAERKGIDLSVWGCTIIGRK